VFAVEGEGVQVKGAGSAGDGAASAEAASNPEVAQSRARDAQVEGASCPDTAPSTAIVTSPAGEGNGSAPSASVGLASGASFLVEGVSTTLWHWGLGREDEGLQNRVVISIQQNNSIPL
jgi:hypothetical protein